MITHKHNNVTLHVTTINPEWVDYQGQTILHLNGEMMAEMCEYNCLFWEFLDPYRFEHLFGGIFDLDDAQEQLIEFAKANPNYDFEIDNTDCIIAVYEYCFGEDKYYEFEMETENVSWILHDLMHADFDAAGCTIYVQADIEKQRIFDSLRQTQELYPNHMPSLQFFEELEHGFRMRFKESIDLVGEFIPEYYE